MITKENFTRINNDVNGNPRYVIHFTSLYTDTLKEFNKGRALGLSGIDIAVQLYKKALDIAKKSVGGRKYNTKNYTGYIVIQSYNLDYEVNALNKALDESKQGTN